MQKLLIIIVLSVVFTGCAFKSVMKGEADDILKACMYTYDGKNYLVMLETVFQATSKESGRGLTTVSGFNELRISVYDLYNGNLLIRKKTGKEIKQPIHFLGCTKGNLWFFSIKEGIHSLHPESLEIKISQDTIFMLNPDLRGNIATCEWYQLSRFFQFDEIKHQIVLTDTQGYRYFLDPENLKATRIPWEYHSFEPGRDHPFVSAVTCPQPYFSIAGDIRKQIKVGNKEVNPQLTFLEGAFIADRNPVRVLDGIDRKLSLFMLKAETLYPRIQTLNQLNGGQGPRWGERLRDTLRMLENYRYGLESDIKNLEKHRTDIMNDGSSFSYTQLLSPDTTSFFVFHRSGTQQDARVVISRIEMINSKDIKERWKTEIPGLFFDPSAADETNAFKEVFSKGNPDFRFSFFDRTDDRLIIVWMLHASCLDMHTGKILWKFRV